MTPALRFKIIGERNTGLNMGMSFFVLCPFKQLRVQGPENRDELQPEHENSIPLRFIPIFGANINHIEGHNKKRHPHVQPSVSFTYSLEAERRGHLLVFDMGPLIYRLHMPALATFMEDVERRGLLLHLSKSVEGEIEGMA